MLTATSCLPSGSTGGRGGGVAVLEASCGEREEEEVMRWSAGEDEECPHNGADN